MKMGYYYICLTCGKTVRKLNSDGDCNKCGYKPQRKSLLPKGKFDMRAVAGNVIRKSRR